MGFGEDVKQLDERERVRW